MGKRDTTAWAIDALCLIAFAISYSKLADLALRAGYFEGIAYVWPLIIDGMALVATRATRTLTGGRRAYAWALLIAATAVSVSAAGAAALLPPGPLPPEAAAAVLAAAPLCLLAAQHLAQLTRDERCSSAAPAAAPATAARPADAALSTASHAAPAAPAVPHPAVPLRGTAEPVRHPQVNTGAAPAARVVDLGARRTAAPTTAAPAMPRAAAPRGGAAVAVRIEDAAPPHLAENAAVPHAAPAAVPHLAVDAAPAAAPQTAPDDDTAALRAEAARLLAAGSSLRAISRELGVADRTIRRWRDSGLLAS